MEKMERILIQLIKLERLCSEEGYNDDTLNPSRRLIKELREEMGIRRVSGGKIEYKKEG